MSIKESCSSSMTTEETSPALLLRDSCPKWVTRLGHGANWVFLGLLLDLCTNNCAERAAYAGPIINLLPDVVFFVGIWLLTSPEPGHTRRAVGIRGLTRGVGVLSVGYDIALAGLGYVPDLRIWGFRAIGLTLGSLVLLLTGFHVANLAMRIPDTRLASFAKCVIIGLAILSLLVGSCMAFVESNPSVRESMRGNTTVILVAIPVVFSALILGFTCLWIFYRFQKLVTEEAAIAKNRD